MMTGSFASRSPSPSLSMLFKRFLSILLLIFIANLPLFALEKGACCKEALLQQLAEARDLKAFTELGALYHARKYQMLWDEETIGQLLEAIADRGLNYQGYDYHRGVLRQLLAKSQIAGLEPGERAKLDLMASDAFFRFAKNLYEGEIDWHRFEEMLKENPESHLVWEPNPEKRDYAKELLGALREGRVASLLHSYPPQERDYRQLIEAHHRYAHARFPKVDYLKDLKLGDYGYEVSQLKYFLKATGDLRDADKKYLDFPTYDKRLETAVRRFQKRHYLKQNGIFDRVNALYAQRSAADKLAQIDLNIERYKLFPRRGAGSAIVINIPGFWLHFFEQGSLVSEIGVVIGREDRPTPIFRDYLEYIVLNPTWSIPQNLMKKDYIRHLVENPKSLLEDDIHIYQGGREVDPTRVDWSKYLDYEGNIPYQMIQKAGPKNVLGAMKFIFPNRYNVYLHDTNAKHLTTRRYRLYSSGCIRLSEPYVLLGLLAPYTHYSDERLLKMIDSGKTVHVRLKRKIPVHIRYLTVFVDSEGLVHFRKDFYGYDRMQQALLNPSW